ncbi:hypothetical protein V2H45_07765 [Tumidithrix elongata RA019]|uniref:Uncharacterized protein n=1 Tax=Tumidithrix elongata BACA0141 TaxID=2716417 RepID=A0AAW9Q1F1_9CYAN|nr:hypothetical protein [Tumidithrix elongata RA019]
MTIDNSRTGKRYFLTIEGYREQWQSFWHVAVSEGKPSQNPIVIVDATSAYEAFAKAKDLIEDEDEDVIGVDWQYEYPLPPWLLE